MSQKSFKSKIITAEQEREENIDGLKSIQNDSLNSVGDTYVRSIPEERLDYWGKEVVTVPEETISDEKITDDSQSQIWNREDEMEFPPLEDEDQISARKKGLPKRR